ncbi:MAG: BA14K family protein [Hyphomicrobiales bacterium]|nr:BA14K family protein [Hyphomicrobiales bacterium]
MNETSLAKPWTPAWYSYCRSKFRSFNAKSGTFLGFDGKRHFCVPK